MQHHNILRPGVPAARFPGIFLPTSTSHYYIPIQEGIWHIDHIQIQSSHHFARVSPRYISGPLLTIPAYRLSALPFLSNPGFPEKVFVRMPVPSSSQRLRGIRDSPHRAARGEHSGWNNTENKKYVQTHAAPYPSIRWWGLYFVWNAHR